MNASARWPLIAGVIVLAAGFAFWALTDRPTNQSVSPAPQAAQDHPAIRSPDATSPLSPPDATPPGQPSYHYNAAGQLTEILYADGSTYSYSYNGHGDKTRETDRTGKTWLYIYDAHQHPLTVIDPGGHATQIAAPAANP